MFDDSLNIDVRQAILMVLKDSTEPLTGYQIYQQAQNSACIANREMISKQLFFMCRDGVIEQIKNGETLLCYQLSHAVLDLLDSSRREDETPSKPKTTQLVFDALHRYYQEDDDSESVFMSDAKIAALVQPALSNSAVRHAVIRLINAGHAHIERKPGFSRILYRPSSETQGNTEISNRIHRAIQVSKKSVLSDDELTQPPKKENPFDYFLKRAGILAKEHTPLLTTSLACNAESFSMDVDDEKESVIINNYGQEIKLSVADAKKLMYFVFSYT